MKASKRGLAVKAKAEEVEIEIPEPIRLPGIEDVITLADEVSHIARSTPALAEDFLSMSCALAVCRALNAEPGTIVKVNRRDLRRLRPYIIKPGGGYKKFRLAELELGEDGQPKLKDGKQIARRVFEEAPPLEETHRLIAVLVAASEDPEKDDKAA